MSRYNLEVLNDKEFEELCKDLLEAELRISFQIFKSGRDKGIDLRYARNGENEIIVQAKRFVKSTYSNLKTTMGKEKSKMDKLSCKPRRYILMTTLDLSVKQVDEICMQLKPYIINSQDIYSETRIMNLLEKHPFIEQKYYKLWLTSTNVLNLILNNGVHGRSEFVKAQILKKVALYVPTNNFDLAIKRLNDNHFLIVSGEPGIGKTTISYLLLCDLMAKGFQLICVDDQLKDAEDLLSPSTDTKQVIFFDDFFGANLSEIINPRNSESKIVSFIERIRTSKNKLLIMTTRTTILKQAQYRFEKFDRSGFGNLSQYELEIKSYSKLDKAKILYNHMYHSGMTPNQFDVFIKSQNYLKIINHKNYFPRLIEFITSPTHLKASNFASIEQFIFDSLNNPKEIWHYAYEQQLNEEEKFLLLTLFSLGGYNVNGIALEKAFECRCRYEIREYGYTSKTDAYRRALKKLTDGFIRCEKSPNSEILIISLLNPSIGDFVINFLRDRFTELKRILFSAAYFEQITNILSTDESSGIVLSSEQLKLFYLKFNEMVPIMFKLDVGNVSNNISALYIYLRYFRDYVTEDILFEIIRETDLYHIDVDYNELYFVLNNLDEYDSTKAYIFSNWISFFTCAIQMAEDRYDISRVLELAFYYHLYEEQWSESEFFMNTLKWKLDGLFNSFDVEIIDQKDDVIDAYNRGYRDRALEAVHSAILEDFEAFLEDCSLSNHFELFHSEMNFESERVLEMLIENHENEGYHVVEERRHNTSTVEDEDSAIHQLFEK